VPPTCSSSGTFTGCNRNGHSTCTDFGGPGYPNWDQDQWNQCHDACQLANRNDYCTWIPPTFSGWAWSGPGQDFSGCARRTHPPCTDWGNASYPNWDMDVWTECQQLCTGTCPAANPNDNVPDDDALNACLAAGGTIKLVPGSPGYIIATGLTVAQDGTTLTSAAAPGMAKLVADGSLAAFLLYAFRQDALEVSYISFDGNRPARDIVGLCGKANSANRANTSSNISLQLVTNGAFHHNRSTGTLCGTAFGFHGSGFVIEYNLIDENGHGIGGELDAGRGGEPWSDGMTLGLCEDTVVRFNTVVDATDIGIVDGGGEGCQITNNYVYSVSRHAGAGIQLGVFTYEGNGDHLNSLVSDNRIFGSGGLVSIGLSFGAHPWLSNQTYTSYGTMRNNWVSQAIVNLLVEGVDHARISGNTLSAPSGTTVCPGSNPPGPANYTQYHETSSSLGSGWITRKYDACVPGYDPNAYP
jgi:hypothetical protein